MAEIDALAAQLAAAELKRDALRELLREARPFVYALTRNDDLRDRIDAALGRT